MICRNKADAEFVVSRLAERFSDWEPKAKPTLTVKHHSQGMYRVMVVFPQRDDEQWWMNRHDEFIAGMYAERDRNDSVVVKP